MPKLLLILLILPLVLGCGSSPAVRTEEEKTKRVEACAKNCDGRGYTTSYDSGCSGTTYYCACGSPKEAPDAR